MERKGASNDDPEEDGTDDWETYDGDLPSEAFEADEQPPEFRNDWLESSSAPMQAAAMKYWFFCRYQDPAQDTPYNSEEGGYLYIRGGPYDASEELYGRFGGIAPDSVIQRAIEEVEVDGTLEWAPIDDGQDYDDYLSIEPSGRDEPMISFERRISEVNSLLIMEGPEKSSTLLHQVLFGAVISALEAYLAELVAYLVKSNKDVLKALVERTKEFQKRSIPLSDVLNKAERIQDEVGEYLGAQIWHRLDKVRPWMEAVFEIRFPDIASLMKAVETRHDIVHRAGRSKEGEEIKIGPDEVKKLQSDAESFVVALEKALMEKEGVSDEF